MEGINHPQEEEDIMCGGGSGYWVCGILRGEEVFLTSPKGMLRFWEYNTPRNGKSHVMVTL